MDDGEGLKILVADDTEVDRLILENIVKKEGHQVVSACDGQEAVEIFAEQRPDIVLLDALMPRLDGFGAARQIKAMAGEQFIPIIFLTSLTDTQSLVSCLEAGGDDFLSKPYNRIILQAKIKAFNRMREMHTTILEQRDQIALHNEHLLQEQIVAKQVFDNIAHSGCLDASNIKFYHSPLAVFNGDLLLATVRPAGSMLVLVGDFTGHGLPAAVGAMPLASLFYEMAAKGFSMVDILHDINRKLKDILPVGLFCCAAMMEMNFLNRRIKIWNGGLPECLIYKAETATIEQVKSRHLPLGILGDKEFKDDCVHLELSIDDKVFMWSDGIHEARDSSGDLFGEERLYQVFQENKNSDLLFDQIMTRVQGFMGGSERDDDITLIEVQMAEPGTVTAKSFDGLEATGRGGLLEWELEFEVKSSSFQFFDPMPMLLNVLSEVPGLRLHLGVLYTIMAELYSNSLEHGVLGLDSKLKKSPEGFANYYSERNKRVSKVKTGFIKFYLGHTTSSEGGQLIINVKDSGPGFDYSEFETNAHKTEGYCGRGIPLIRTMCQSLQYKGEGNEVEVVYVWRSDDEG